MTTTTFFIAGHVLAMGAACIQHDHKRRVSYLIYTLINESKLYIVGLLLHAATALVINASKTIFIVFALYITMESRPICLLRTVVVSFC